MPEYVYYCEKCSIEFSIIQGINDLACADCVECATITKHRIPQPMMIIDKTPKTLGSLADHRRNEMGQYGYHDTVQKMANERKVEFCGKLPEGTEQVQPTTDRPFWRKDSALPDYSLNRLSPEEKGKYIMEGKKPICTK